MRVTWGLLTILFCLVPRGGFCLSEIVPLYAQLAFASENQGDSARANAMGAAFAGVEGDGAALFWNPAGLAGLSSTQLTLHHKFYLQDFFRDTLLFVTPQGAFGSWGLSVSYLNYGSLQGRDVNGAVTGNFDASRWGGSVAWSHSFFKGFAAGLGLKGNLLSLSGITYSNVAGNIGAMWDPEKSFHLGASFSNWGTDVASHIANSVIRIGGSYDWAFSPGDRALVAVGASLEPFGVAHLNLGAEDLIGSFLALRAGCDLDLANNQLQGLTTLTAGVGFYFRDLALDYAFAPYGDLGTSNQVSLTYRFESKAPAAVSIATPLVHTTPSSPVTILVKPVTLLDETVTIIPATPTPAPSLSRDGDKLRLFFSLPDKPTTPAAPDAGSDSKIRYFQDAIAQNPQDKKSWYQLGNLYYQQGQKADAIQCFEQVLRLEPANQKLRDWLILYRDH